MVVKIHRIVFLVLQKAVHRIGAVRPSRLYRCLHQAGRRIARRHPVQLAQTYRVRTLFVSMAKPLRYSSTDIGKCAALLVMLLLAASTQATPLLRCQVTYAGTTHTVEAVPGPDPYRIPSIDIGGRFRFKAVVLGSQQQIDTINLYAYLDTRRQPILIHQAKYLPPFKQSVAPYALTGNNYLYASDLERELQYNCTLQGVQS